MTGRPEWCRNKKCKYVQVAGGSSKPLCVGMMEEKEVHLNQVNDKRMCFKNERFIFELDMNNNDISWFEFLFGKLKLEG